MDCKQIQSSSSSQTIWKYDVFLSFRGEDTRNNFTDHLFGALYEKGFVIFKDDIKLTKGGDISTELLQAIEESQILIVVFSKNYASSKWCLQELAKIADCINVQGQKVLPIFYDVNPSDVRRQSGNYEKAFAKHEERFKDHIEMIQTWREALSQVASLSGWDISNKAQHGEIGEIVKEVTSILSHNFSTTPNDTVGMQSQVEELENILVLDSNADVKVVGISGMGGIGKSTLVASLYCRISNQFDASCFIDDISKLFGDHGQIDGPIEAQKQILSQTLNGENLPLYNSIKTSNFIQTRLRHKKVLIVLDNVDEAKQLDKLAIKHCLGGGSRIIIISRDEHILQEYQVDKVYTVQLLNYRDALQLFCRKAFKCDDTMRDYIDLTNEALSYANGLPLAIKVLGSFLFGLDVSEWRGALVRLRENPKKDIMDVLRISFDALEDSEKEIFLDISCFFHGNLRENVENILDIRGFHPKIGIKVLIDKSLVTINESETIEMHDLLIELGRSIVREKSPKGPRKWSRLWDCNDLYIVLQENMAAENLEAIGCESSVEFPKTMRADTFSKMICLKLLILRTVRLKFSESLNCLSSELQYLDWDDYPFQYLPPNFEPDKLVELYLCRSSIKQLWKEPKGLHHLRLLNLSYSKNLIKLPNFREIPNLEFLSLEGCIKLVQIDPSIGILTKLVYLNLRYCENLVSIPNIIFGLSSLNQLLLSGCSKLFQNQLLREPRHVDHVKILEINGTGIKHQPTSYILKILKSLLHCFYLERHEESIGLLFPSLPHFLCLEELDLSFCNLLQIPDAIGWLHSLIRLDLGGNNFVALPSGMKELSKLLVLKLEHCKQLMYLPELPVRSKASFDDYVAGLYIFNCPNLIELEQCYIMAFSWMIQLLEVHMQSYLFHGQISIVIRGTEIPRWFSEQKAGDSISMDFTPYIHDENCIGVACCAILLAHDDPTNLGGAWCEEGCVWSTFEYDKHKRHYYFPLNITKDLITVESNHLLLQFFTMEVFINSIIRIERFYKDSVELFISTQQPQGLHLEVKYIGYHWVFEEDLVKFSSMMGHTGNSSSVWRPDLLTNG